MIEVAYTGPERIEFNGVIYAGPNAEGDLARTLIGKGVDPGEMLVFTRNDLPALRGTVDAFAARAWGGASRDPQFVRWRPHPQGNYPLALLRWHSLTAPKPPKVKRNGDKDGRLPGAALSASESPPAAPHETRASSIETNRRRPKRRRRTCGWRRDSRAALLYNRLF
jgi:hypothetical protein